MSYSINIQGQISQKSDLIEYSKNVLDHFFKGRLKRKVKVNIKFVRNLFDEHGNPYGGSCLGNRSSNIVDIVISRGVTYMHADGELEYVKYTLGQIVELLGHELVHAKQFLRGEINNRNMMWRGVEGPVDCEGVRYRNQPWEIEARSYEKVLKKLYWDRVYER
jgi:hypothetical protein